ncbi:MAG TPA: hypothetical protein VJA21_25215 [Verrucomicrobiae bacterium]
MKTLVLIIMGVCLVGGFWLYLARHSTQRIPAQNATLEVPGNSEGSEPASTASSQPDAEAQPLMATRGKAARAVIEANTGGVNIPPAAPPSLPYQQALSVLVSSQAGFEQKQAAWKHLRDSGKLDQVIGDLEQRASANPTVAEYPAALGQACLQKAGTLNDIREQGILGLKADQSFDAALNLDPSNWEAGFWKATAMSYWPPQLGKGSEVITRFVELAKLQEGQPTQPQFAQTYLLLGDQYQKQGYPDYARQTWQRGATLFPNDTTLAQRLTQPTPEQATVR